MQITEDELTDAVIEKYDDEIAQSIIEDIYEQGIDDDLEKIKKKTAEDRLTRIETKMDLIIDILTGNNKKEENHYMQEYLRKDVNTLKNRIDIAKNLSNNVEYKTLKKLLDIIES